MSASSSRDRAQRLYDKNVELETKRRRSAQARVPSDPSAWQQMRENYEAIILEDHAFSEQHNIEYALWQLHYRRIEEFRAHFSAASASLSSTTSQTGKGPNRVTKIRLQFKTFLSEATGFYHDLILKIRSKYGLPIGHFSELTENQIVTEKDGKKTVEMKKGLVSCHRCLIYLGDLARYKGLYGEGESKSRDYAAASSYYMQAASLWPSSGNPHHQLAILATYSGDELLAVYHYFRSLAVDSPFSTAKDNLIVAFEKNRQSYSQLHGDATATATASATKESPLRTGANGRGKAEAKLRPKDANIGISSTTEKATSYKVFCLRFVRLNGIMFTRTSLEMFGEVLSLVSSSLQENLSSGTEEGAMFGTEVVDNGLIIVRLISILIFIVHNVKKEAEGQSYADIVQRAVLLQNALIAVFELMGHIVKRCEQLSDPSSSYLLHGILIFVEWLASCADVAAGNDRDEKQVLVRSNFWHSFISLLNKISCNDNDGARFFNMGMFEDGETENRVALWEDFELRGFLPLQRSQTVLDFSRRHPFGGDGKREKMVRAKRVLAAGKTLADIVRVDQKTLSFDLKLKKFVIGVELQNSDDIPPNPFSDSPELKDKVQETSTDEITKTPLVLPKADLYLEGEEDDDDEVIVFKPTVIEKRNDAIALKRTPPREGLEPGQNAFVDDSKFYAGPVSSSQANLLQTSSVAVSQPPVSIASIAPQHLPAYQPHSSTWLEDNQASLADGLKGLSFFENGHIMKPGIQPKIDTSASFEGPMLQSSGITSGLPASSIRGPANRPVRHLGPPPGFTSIRPKMSNEPILRPDLATENQIMGEYKPFDGYQLPPSSSIKFSGLNQPIGRPFHSNSLSSGNGNSSVGVVTFPFPGKQAPAGWQDRQIQESLKLHHEQLQQQQFIPMPDQFDGQVMRSGRYFV